MSNEQDYVHCVIGLENALVPQPYIMLHVNWKEECPLPDFTLKTNIISVLCAIYTEISPTIVTVINDCV